MYTICLPCVFVLLYFQLKPASTTTASAAATSASATCSSATTTASVITSSASSASATATMPSHLSTDLDPADEPVESGSLGEPRVCSTPPPGITLSGTSGRRATRRSASTESELLDKMCEQSDNSAQISYRLDRLLTSMEAQTNDRTAWAGWMSSAMLKIHEDLWPTYQIRSMDLLNQTIKESKLLSERDIQRQELDRQKQLDDRQKQLYDRQKQLDSMQQQMKVQQQLIFQQPQPQQQYTITQMPPPPAPGPAALASSTPLPQGSDTQSQTTVIFQTPSGASTSGQSVGSSSSTSSTKFVITDTEGRTIGLSDLNLSDLNASFAGIPSVPSTSMTPVALLNQDDSQGS